MKMLSIIGKRLFIPRKTFFKQNLRYFLSNSYNCQEVWEQRKQATLFQKVDFDDLYHQLDRCFQTGQRVSILDVDVFLNGIHGESYQNELEDVIFKLRGNPETSLMAERTIHAVVRFYIEAGMKKELLHILSNRLTYGIFLDDYAANMLMDAFLKEDDATSAAKVAVLVMLQEDFSHPITRILSVYSCLKYLNGEDVWEKVKPVVNEDDDEEIKERVRYIRNPYFDDHFDLTEPNHMIGKTLFMAGGEIHGPLGKTCQLIGLILWEKFEKVLEMVGNGEFLDSGVEMAVAFTKTTPKTAEPGEMTEQKEKVIRLLENVKRIPGDVLSLAEVAVKETVEKYQPQDVKKLAELYKNWEKEREADLQKELFESKKRQTIDEIQKTKKTLATEEEVIFYFDKEEQWDLKVENKEAEIRAFEKENVSKKKNEQNDPEYIPPDVSQKYNV